MQSSLFDSQGTGAQRVSSTDPQRYLGASYVSYKNVEVLLIFVES